MKGRWRLRDSVLAGLIAAFAFVASCSYAQGSDAADLKTTGDEKSLSVAVPTEGEHFVRFLPSSDAKQPAQLPIRFLDRTTTVKYRPSDIGKTASIAIDDAQTGNTAIRPLAGPGSPSGGSLELKRTDFDRVRQVDISVNYQGAPLKLAHITLTPQSGHPVTKLIDTTSRGTATFEDVPAGRAKVTVLYGDRLTQTQDVDILTDRPPGPLRISIAVTTAVPTLPKDDQTGLDASKSTGASAPPGSAPPAPTAPAGGGIGGLLSNLLGLAVAAGAIYALYRWAQSGGMAATLKKAGIEVAASPPDDGVAPAWKPSAPPPPIVADPSACQFCGQPKDAAGNCACSTVSGAAVTTASASSPRLVGAVGTYAGSVFAVSPTTTIGREATNTVALPNDTTVSRRHATLRSQGDMFEVADEGSSNGVYVNGVRISGTASVRPGDEIQIGATRFRLEA